MIEFEGKFTLLRNITNTYTQNKRVVSREVIVAGAIMSTDGWVLNNNLPERDLFTTNIIGYHRFIKYETNRKIRQKTIIRMSYHNCYLGVYSSNNRCAMPFIPQYFEGFRTEGKTLIFQSIHGFIPMLQKHLIVAVSPYIDPLLGNSYIEWLNEISIMSLTGTVNQK